MQVGHVTVFVLGIQMLVALDVFDDFDSVLMSLISLMHMYDFKFALDLMLLLCNDDNLSHRLIMFAERNKMVE